MTDFLNLIAGESVAGDGVVENRNPSDVRDLIGTYAQATIAQLHETVAAAPGRRRSFGRRRVWRRVRPFSTRSAGELMARSAELGRELSREEGKPLAEGVGEVYR